MQEYLAEHVTLLLHRLLPSLWLPQQVFLAPQLPLQHTSCTFEPDAHQHNDLSVPCLGLTRI